MGDLKKEIEAMPQISGSRNRPSSKAGRVSPTPAAAPGFIVDRAHLDVVFSPVSQHRVTSVVAPAGWGKSTALRQFVASNTGSTVLVQGDLVRADRANLLNVMANHLGVSLPDLEGEWRDGLDAAIDIERHGGHRVTVIVDDVDTLAPTDMADLAMLMRRAPQNLGLVLSSRRAPDIDLTRLRLDGHVTDIGPDELRFGVLDTARLIRSHAGVRLSFPEIARLTTELDGWPAGLRLFLLSASVRPIDEQRRIIGLACLRTPIAREYIHRNLIEPIDKEAVDFAIEVSPLGSFDADLCAAFRQRPDSAAALPGLDAFPFVAPAGGSGARRMHPIIRRHLEALLRERLSAKAFDAALERAGRLLAEAGQRAEAARCFAAAGCWSDLAETVALFDESDLSLTEWLLYTPQDVVSGHQGILDASRAITQQRGSLAADLRLAPSGAEHESPIDVLDKNIATAVGAVVRGRIHEARSILAELEADPCTPKTRVPLIRVVDYAASVLSARPEPCRVAAAPPRLDRVVTALSSLGGRRQGSDDANLVVEWCDADGDEWGALVARTIQVLSLLSGADPPDLEPFDDAARRCRSLDLAVVSNLIDAARTLAEARRGDEITNVASTVSSARHHGGVLAELLAMLAQQIAHPLLDRAAHIEDMREASGLGWLLNQGPAVATDPVPRGIAVNSATTDQRPAVALRCLGGLEVLADGTPLDLQTLRPRVRSLFSILSLQTDQMQHREGLIESLWPYASPESALRGLQVAVSQLRQFLEGTATLSIVREREAYGLVLEPGTLADIPLFVQAATRARHRSRDEDWHGVEREATLALDIYRGPLLPSEGPAEWVLEPRERLRLGAAHAAALGAEASMNLSRPRAAISFAEQGLRLDSHSDRLWRLRIDALEAASEPVIAAKARDGYHTMLAGLGVRS